MRHDRVTIGDRDPACCHIHTYPNTGAGLTTTKMKCKQRKKKWIQAGVCRGRMGKDWEIYACLLERHSPLLVYRNHSMLFCYGMLRLLMIVLQCFFLFLEYMHNIPQPRWIRSSSFNFPRWWVTFLFLQMMRVWEELRGEKLSSDLPICCAINLNFRTFFTADDTSSSAAVVYYTHQTPLKLRSERIIRDTSN